MNNMCYGQKVLCRIVIALMCITLCASSFIFPANALASTAKEDMITSLKNSGNAKLTFNLTIPAKTTANYSVKFTPNNKNAAIDSLTGKKTNGTSETQTYKITVYVNFYSSKYNYSVKANYNYKKKNYADTDTVKSLLPASKTFYSEKVNWNKAKVEQYNKNKRREEAVKIGGTAILNIVIFKGTGSTCKLAVDKISNAVFKAAAGTCDAASVALGLTSESYIGQPVVGWSYKIKAVTDRNNNQIKLSVIEYDNEGGKTERKLTAPRAIDPYCPVIR